MIQTIEEIRERIWLILLDQYGDRIAKENIDKTIKEYADTIVDECMSNIEDTGELNSQICRDIGYAIKEKIK